MKISFENPLIYFHVPKCAGTSVSDFLQREFGKDLVKSPATYIDYNITPSNYNKFKVYAGHLYYDQLSLLPRGGSYMTILRNPGSRLISLYNYFKSLDISKSKNMVAANLAQKLDFHDWLECGNPEVIHDTSNAIVRHFAPKSFFFDQTPACRQNILFASQQFANQFSLIGFSEYLDTTMDIAKQTFEFSQPFESLKFLNKNNYNGFSFSKSRLKNFIQNDCSLDLDFLSYCVSIFKRQCTDDHLYKIKEIEKSIYLDWY
jgi:hypothetical protein